MVLVVKNLPADVGNIRDEGSIPGSGRSPGEDNDNPLQYSWLENSMESLINGIFKNDTNKLDYKTEIDPQI